MYSSKFGRPRASVSEYQFSEFISVNVSYKQRC